MARATSQFTLDRVDAADPYEAADGVAYTRTVIDKTFKGDFDGTSRVEMLSVTGAAGGAAYVALESLAGSIEGRAGGFALAHIGTMTADGHWARWPIAPGSGTGGLAGISGEATIEIAPDGTHTLHLDYELA